MCRFPSSAYLKVTQKLEAEKISYTTYEKDKLIKEYKGIAKNYDLVLKKALANLDTESRINLVKEKIENCSIADLEKLIEVIESGSFK